MQIKDDEQAKKYIWDQMDGLRREVNMSFNGNYDQGYIVEKLRNIAKTYGIEFETRDRYKKDAAELAKDYELEDTSNFGFFDYILESIINGQHNQAQDLIDEMDTNSLRGFHEYLFNMDDQISGEAEQKAMRMLQEHIVG